MEYTQENPLRLIELFAGIGSQTPSPEKHRCPAQSCSDLRNRQKRFDEL